MVSQVKAIATIIILLANIFIVNTIFGQTTTLATYYFENNLNAQVGAIGSPTLTASSANYSNFTTCQGSYSFSAGTSGIYVELTISTTGYENIGVRWTGRRSNSSSNSWLLTANSGPGYGSTFIYTNQFNFMYYYTNSNISKCIR